MTNKEFQKLVLEKLEKLEENVGGLKDGQTKLEKGQREIRKELNYVWNDKDCFYFSTYDEIEENMSRFKVEKLEHVATDGIVHMMRDNINFLDEGEFNK